LVILVSTALVITFKGGCVQYHHSDLSQTNSGEYPNPFCPNLEIAFELPEPACVTLTIYNVLGQPVRDLVDAEMAAGRHSLEWDGLDDYGNEVDSGVYFWRVITESFTKVGKTLVLR